MGALSAYRRTLAALASVAALFCSGGAGLALASPDGDDDPAYNANGATGFGTQYSLISASTNGAPVTTQDRTAAGAGSSVTATLLQPNDGDALQLTRYDIAGEPVAAFGDNGVKLVDLPETKSGSANSLLDIRVLDDGTIVVLVRRTSYDSGDELWALSYDAAGELLDSESTTYDPPEAEACIGEIIHRGEGGGGPTSPSYHAAGFIDAARVGADGDVSALWDCYDAPDPSRAAHRNHTYHPDAEGGTVFIAHYDSAGGSETDQRVVVAPNRGAEYFGQDLELGPTGDPYVLVGGNFGGAGRSGRGALGSFSQVFHYALGETATMTRGSENGVLVPQDPTTGSDTETLPGLPVDLAVDHQSRPLVWRQAPALQRGGNYTWLVSRLTSGLASDTGWGTDGTTTISDPRLGYVPGYRDSGYTAGTPFYLTVRPDDRVIVTGPDRENYDRRQAASTTTVSYNNAVMAGLTNTGQTDSGFGDAATPGFKYIDFAVPADLGDGFTAYSASFQAIGEPKLQSDGKVFFPHVTGAYVTGQARIAPPPVTPRDRDFVGVTRLRLPATTGGGSPQSRPVSPSSVPAICGRRAISLVRADVRGRKVRLTGLVGSAFYGKKVTIQTDPKGAKASAYSRTATVTASKSTGSFSVSVPRPKASEFASVRYRATVGRAKSPALKLPQSLTSRSVKSSKGTITIKGRVKKSVLGKRNKVKIRRLACGRYRTVGTAKPDANGNYSVTFKATALRGVSFYRAEAVVQVRPGSKKYAIQYARAIAIKTTSQTG